MRRNRRPTDIPACLQPEDWKPTGFNLADELRLRQDLRRCLADWSGLAQRHPSQTRQVIREVLPHRTRVWRAVHGDDNCYRYEGKAAVGRFFSGLVRVLSLILIPVDRLSNLNFFRVPPTKKGTGRLRPAMLRKWLGLLWSHSFTRLAVSSLTY